MTMTLSQVKAKSESRGTLKGLHPSVLAGTNALIERAYKLGIYILITEGLRDIDYQNSLYAKGRTQAQLNSVGLSHVKARPDLVQVTNAIGGKSMHNYGLAIDFALLSQDGKNVYWDMNRDENANRIKDWDEVVKEGKALGFAWGGDFKSIYDPPHLEMAFGLTVSKLQSGIRPTETQNAIMQAKITRYMKEVENDMRVDKASTKVNGVKLTEESVLIEGRTYVPLAAIGKALGATVGFDNATKTASIDLKK